MPRPKTLQKQQAKYLYFTTSRTQREIATAVGVTPKALSHWVVKEAWAEEKKKAYYSPEQILHQLYEQLREINENILARDEGKRYGTKEELEANTKILALITNTLKNTHDIWRNVTPDFDIKTVAEPREDEPLNIDIYREGSDKKIGSIKAGDIPIGGKLPNGAFAHDQNTAHEYYTRVAVMLASVDNQLGLNNH
jgi:hypothetical protein